MPETINVISSIENNAGLSFASSPSATTASFDPADLDLSIIRAAEFGFFIAPVLAHSRIASARSYMGALSSDIGQIAQAAAHFRNCNWTTNLALSRLTVLEVDTRIGYVPLSTLCRNSFGRWTKTLQFRDADSRFFLFRSIGHVVLLKEQFQGLKAYTGNAFMLLPPSTFVETEGLAYSDVNAALMDAPDFLKVAPSSCEEGKILLNPSLAA